jgi:hypothetical protein
MSQTKAQLVSGLNLNPSAPATALQIDASGNINLDSNTLYVDATNNRVGLGTSTVGARFHIEDTDSSSAYTTGAILGTQTSIYKQIVHTNQSTGTNEAGIVLRAGTSSNIAEWGLSAVRTGATSGDLLFRTRTGAATSAEIMRLTSTGLGIGTTSPSTLLDLQSASPTLRLAPTTQNNSSSIELGVLNAGVNAYAKIDATNTATYDTNIRFWTNTSGSTTQLERARITSDGKFLVGTSTSRSRGNIEVEGTTTSNASCSLISNAGETSGSSAYLFLGKSRGTTVGSNTVVASGDQLGGIGWSGTDGTALISAAEIRAEVDGTPGANDMPGRLVFSTCSDGSASPSERVRITSGGHFKASNSGSYQNASGSYHEIINSVNANETLVVRHTGTSGNQYGIVISTSNDQNDATRYFLYCNGSTTQRMSVRANGGIYNYSANNSNLCDEREKKNIVNLDSTWDCLKHWELKKFHYNEDADTDDLRYGVIAQQVADYCPEVISEWVKQKAEPAKLDDEGNEIESAKEEIVRMGVKEQQMMWMAIKALQEAQVRIEELEVKVAALEGA